jgi:NitT/TauT family transport system substrate-binding protein
MNTIARTLLASLGAIALGTAVIGTSASAEETVKIGTVRSVTNAAILIGEQKGYFKKFGIKVELEYLQSSATGMASLAQGQLNIIAGGISAGYFNALDKNLPIIITVDRATTPIGHNLMIRPDLKDTVKSLKDLKGKVVASNAPGSISTYEIGKMMESVGLSIADVEIKNIPFGQYAAALKNKAVDGVLAIPPFTYGLTENGLALPFAAADSIIKPAPMTIAVQLLNTEWAKPRQELVRNFYVAMTQGIRDFCNGYHGAPIRKELVELLVSSKNETRPELLDKYPWVGRNLNGKINPESLLDIQDWYVKNKFITTRRPIEKLVDYSYSDYAQKTLGPFTLENKDSKTEGCR